MSTIYKIIAVSEWKQGKHSMRKRLQPEKNLPKPILWYRNVYNQINSQIWETDNPVY